MTLMSYKMNSSDVAVHLSTLRDNASRGLSTWLKVQTSGGTLAPHGDADQQSALNRVLLSVAPEAMH